jgi:hypothetical protein
MRNTLALLLILFTVSCDRSHDGAAPSVVAPPQARQPQPDTKQATHGIGAEDADKATRPMPLSPNYCESLYRKLRDIQADQPGTAQQSSYPNQVLATLGAKAVRALGFDFNATLQAILLGAYDARSSCGDVVRLVPTDPDKAAQEGLISEDTLKVFRMQQRFVAVDAKLVSPLIAAVSECEEKTKAPCELADVVRFFPENIKYGNKNFRESFESKDPIYIDGFAQYSLGCATTSNMQFFVDEKGSLVTCDSFHDKALRLSMKKDAADDYARYQTFMRQRQRLLDESQ